LYLGPGEKINKNKKKELRMQSTDDSPCLKAFNNLCEALSVHNLVSLDESQYMIFERGYKAALDELINNMAIAAMSQSQLQLDKVYLSGKEIGH
jgi:hypothetical protein